MRVRFLAVPALAVVTTQLALAGAAIAQTAPRLVDASGLEWLFTNDVVADAGYVGAVRAEVSGPVSETHLAVLADAFDGYGALTVSVDGGAATPFTRAWAGATECGGRQMVFPAQTVGGVSVSRKIYVPTDDSFARWATIISNPGAAPATVTLTVSGNLGSDSRTTIGATSDQDTVASPVEQWVVTFGAFAQGASREPRLAHVLASPGAAVQPSDVAFANGDDTPSWRYVVPVPAGGTAVVTHFAAGEQTLLDAALKASYLAALPPTAVACLSTTEQAQLVNARAGVIPSGPLNTGTARLEITSPTSADAFTAGGPFISIGGIAGSSGLLDVTWSSNRGGSGTALGANNWVIPNVRLAPGPNVITVTANYGTGALTDTITVQLDSLTYMLPEGATGSFFTTDVLIANPNPVEAQATVTFLKGDGTTVTLAPQTLLPTSRTTLRLNAIPGVSDTGTVSTVVTTATATPLVVERTMFWDGSSYGSHGAMAQEGPRTSFLFGEGAQGFFDTYLLLANPGNTKATTTVQFFRTGETPVTRTFEIAPTSRFNVFAGSIPELANRAFSMAVTSDTPIMAERAMYFGSPLFEGGHDSEGATLASPSWNFAEGASGSFFDTYFLIGNATSRTAAVTMTYLLPDGTTVPVARAVAPFSRATVLADEDAPALANTAFSVSITSTEPITAERSMYWAGTGTSWYEAHNALGVVEAGTRWGLAEGRVGGPEQFETYILVANAGTDASVIRATFLRKDGGTIVKQFTVQPRSRFNLHVNTLVPELANEEFSTVVDVIEGSPVIVERSLYHSSEGVQFRGGTNTQAMRLP